MKGFFAFVKKELFEGLRTGKLLLSALLFLLFGVMNPALAKITPWLLDLVSDQLADAGMTLPPMEVNALTSWAQFYKNMPLMLLLFAVIFGGILTNEYRKGTLIQVVTKGFPRGAVLAAKEAVLILYWLSGCTLSYAVTALGTLLFWKDDTVPHLALSFFCFFLFGLFVLALLFFFSALFSSFSSVLLTTGGSLMLLSLVGIVPTLTKYLPTSLLDPTALLTGGAVPGDFTAALVITLTLTLAGFVAAFPLFRKKSL